MNSCLLLCGFPKTGRDQFVNDLIFGNREWIVYFDPKNEKPNIEDHLYKMRYRLSFEDEGKKLTAQMLGLPSTIDDMDRNKDRLIVSTRLLRDHIRDVIAKERIKQKDPAYWVKKAIETSTKSFENVQKKLENQEHNITSEKMEYIVPDFSFSYELEYIQSLKWEIETVRFFNKDIEIPKDKSYHTLDKFLTDYVLIPKNNHVEHWNQCLQYFPQYKNLSRV